MLHARPVLEPRQPGDPPAHDRPRRSGATPTARSTCSSPASAPAARSPARARCSRSATRTCTWWRSSRPARRCSRAGSPGPHKIQGIGAGFVPAVLNREVLDEIVPVDDEDAIETARLLRAPRGRAGGHLVRRRAVGGDRGRRAPGDARQADRRGPARLRRALRLHAVLRALMLGLGTLARGRRASSARTSTAAAGARPGRARRRAGSRSSPPGPACTRCSRIASRTRCTRRACRCCRALLAVRHPVADRHRDPSGRADRPRALHRPRHRAS